MTSRGLEILTAEECRDLLRGQTIGRIALRIGEAPAILPVTYTMLDGDVVFRTDPGSKLSAALMQVLVAFEVDEVVPMTHAGWSVNVTGYAQEDCDQATRDRVDALGLEPWVVEGRDYVIRVRPRTITGRRLPAHPVPGTGR